MLSEATSGLKVAAGRTAPPRSWSARRPVFGKGDALDRLFSSDYQEHNPLIANGTAAIKAIKAIIAGLSPDFKYEPGLAVADGEHMNDSWPVPARNSARAITRSARSTCHYVRSAAKIRAKRAICMSPHSYNRNRGVADEQRLMERTGA